jgi:hypothetical protein
MTEERENVRGNLAPIAHENASEDGTETIDPDSGDFVANRCGRREPAKRVRASFGLKRIIATATRRKIASA